LRALLNDFIQKHSMDEALAVLRSFGCVRLTDAAALPAEKLSALVARISTGSTPPSAVEVITKEQLTATVKDYLTRHTEQEAFDIMQSFGCGRISDAMALPAEKLSELVSKLNG
jgi:hypothetical protein